MSFDETYNKILNKNIILQDNFLESAIDWVSGKLKDTVKWTTEKLHTAIQIVFNKLSQNNEQICKKVVQNIYSILPKDQQKQIATIKEQLNTKEFKQYFANKIKENYSQNEIQNISENQKKDLLVKYAEEYLKSKSIISEEIILEAWQAIFGKGLLKLAIKGALVIAGIITGIWFGGEAAKGAIEKIDTAGGFTEAGKARNKAKAEKIKQQSKLEQEKQQLHISNLQQERLNIALAN